MNIEELKRLEKLKKFNKIKRITVKGLYLDNLISPRSFSPGTFD